MKKRIPVLPFKYKICIICEGDEEYDYLNKLKDLKVWNEQYDVVLDNANGNGNIPARYQDRYQNGSFDIVFIFCDTEKKPCEQYHDIKRKINLFHGNNASDEILIYGNPCTMQIIIAHWDDQILKSPAKKVNSAIIEKFTNIKNYKGKKEQRAEIISTLNQENYLQMYQKVSLMPHDDTITGSTNFDKLLNYLSSQSNAWIQEINDKLEEASEQ